jgi:hypothetical protein
MFDFYKNPFYRYKNNFIFFVIFLWKLITKSLVFICEGKN